MESDFRSILTGAPAVVALVGNRIEPAQSAQSKIKPRITYQRITGVEFYHLVNSTELVNAILQVNCFGNSYAEAVALEKAVVNRLKFFSGIVGETKFDVILLVDRRDAPTPPGGGQMRGVDCRQLDFDVHYREDIPTQT